MKAELLRCLKDDTFCVVLSQTSAVVCVQCHVDDDMVRRLRRFCPYDPLPIQITLGEYEVQQAIFKGCVIDWGLSELSEPPKTTAYKRVKV